MPVYAYVCETCGTEFDAFASIQKKESGWQPRCPKCGSVQTRHVFKAVAMIARPSSVPPRGGCCSSR